MDTILNFLSGKKTYLLSGIALIVVGFWMYGLINDEIAMKALIALGFGTQITLRSAAAKAEAQAVETAQKVAALQRGDRAMIG